MKNFHLAWFNRSEKFDSFNLFYRGKGKCEGQIKEVKDLDEQPDTLLYCWWWLSLLCWSKILFFLLICRELCVPCSRCAGMTPKSRGKICQPCASPNNLVTAAENSRLTILLRRERRSAFIMSIIIITFIICWMPAFTIYFVSWFWKKKSKSKQVQILSEMGMSTSFWNEWILGWIISYLRAKIECKKAKSVEA